ncbi:hypothetical protein COOONC_17885, partial [Cooperia oncophora]
LAQIKTNEPQLKIEVRHHKLKDCYALYLTAGYKSLLKGAELCHIKKPVKSRFGGGLREFSFEEAQCFSGIEGRNTFLTDTERALIVKQIVDMMRAPAGGLTLDLPTRTIRIREGMAIGEQPVDEIRDYFGTEIAMYFSWLGHMTTALWFPALLGLFMYFFTTFKYKSSIGKEDKADSFQVRNFFNCSGF